MCEPLIANKIPNVKESSMHHFETEVDMDDPFI